MGQRLLKTALLGAVAALSVGAASLPAQAGKTLDAIKERGQVNCGVHTGRPGFAIADSQGKWSGMDVDFCRALATAVLGDESKVRYVPTTGTTRITALQSGEIDVLARNTTWTMTRDASLGLLWAGVNYYDGQAFITRKNPKVKSVKDLNGATICVDAGTTTEKNLADYFRANKMSFKPVVFEHQEATIEALKSGRCHALTGDATALSILRAKDLGNPDDYAILPEMISKEPVGPAVRRGDDEWFTIVRWTLNAMIEAEEYGVSQANVDQMKAESKDPGITRLLGTSEDMGRLAGMDKEWAYRIIKQVGNYGDSFDRNLGAGSSLKLERGLTQLWTKGGLFYAMPVR